MVVPVSSFVGYFDGSCGPKNPGGTMGVGAYILHDSKRIWQISKIQKPQKDEPYFRTNNVAEYAALWYLLRELIDRNLLEDILIRGDSVMVINQMRGMWRINHGAYTFLAEKCKSLLPHFKNLEFQWVPRDNNSEADELSNNALRAAGINPFVLPAIRRMAR